MKYQEVKGDLFKMASEGKFDVIAHGCNCFCIQGAGIALSMKKIYKTNLYPSEGDIFFGDINKLGNIQIGYHPYQGGLTGAYYFSVKDEGFPLAVVNCYTQYDPGIPDPVYNIPLNYNALAMCMRKLNHTFKGKSIGLPQIGAGLAGGDWEIISGIIKEEITNCYVTVVIYENK